MSASGPSLRSDPATRYVEVILRTLLTSVSCFTAPCLSPSRRFQLRRDHFVFGDVVQLEFYTIAAGDEGDDGLVPQTVELFDMAAGGNCRGYFPAPVAGQWREL